MAVVKWIESKTTLLRHAYLRLRYEGMERNEIRSVYFNDDIRLFRDQLVDWELLSLDSEWEALRQMGKTLVAIELTKEQYLQRRLKGETRTKIARSLGVATQRFYDLLTSWGIRELDAEERELELLVPTKSKINVAERVAEEIEEKAEARKNQQWPEDVVAELERPESGEGILKRMEQRAESQEKELASLQAAVELWKHDAERKSEHIVTLETEIERLTQLNAELETGQQHLLQTIERAVLDSELITFRIPIVPVQIAVQERSRIYDALECLSSSVEGAEINRQRVAFELFELLQRVVNFVTADLTELHPGKDATAYIHEFFNYYNKQHLNVLENITKVG